MDKKTTGIIATVAAVLLCGCPGLIGLCMGATFALVGGIPGAEIDMWGSNDPQSAITFGIVAMCLGVLFIAVPIVVGFVTLRNKPAPAPVSTPDEPLPPAI